MNKFSHIISLFTFFASGPETLGEFSTNRSDFIGCHKSHASGFTHLSFIARNMTQCSFFAS